MPTISSRSVTADGSVIEYTLQRGGVKNINLRIRKDGSVRVSAPTRVPLGKLDEFVISRAEFILSARERFRELEAKRPEPAERIPDAECRALLRAVVDEVYPVFERIGIEYPTLKFRDMKTRWGTCNPRQGAITLNKRLCYAPRECIEYVVMHEFCHFLHPNHSAHFYALLAEVCPDHRERKKRLNDSAAAWV